MKRAVVLLSGGLDSSTTLALAKEQGFEVHALSIRYGQRHSVELEAAGRVARSLGAAKHLIVAVDLAAIGGSALTDEIAVPMDRPYETMEQGIPATYVPARNTVLLSLALGYAEVIGAFDIFLGVNVLDYSGYPDCRPEYIEQFAKLANLATKSGVEKKGQFRIHTPLILLTKAEIIREGQRLGLDFRLTHSCYAPSADGRACGRCDSCRLRLKGFAEAGLTDPIAYISGNPPSISRVS
jgi:7-cyano-7-deazaguanine synthase